MDLGELTKLIKTKHKNNKYSEALYWIDAYFETKNAGIYDVVLDMYIDCQIKLGKFEDAVKNIELMNRIFPGSYTEYDTLNRLSLCGNVEKLANGFEKYSLSSKEYYNLAKNYYYCQKYDIATKLFEYALIFPDSNEFSHKANQYLTKIKRLKKMDDTFEEVSYPYLKSTGKSLEPGHIIYVEKLNNKYMCNKVNDDPKKDTRPYMIWKIDKNLIYGFPVATARCEKDLFRLFRQNYGNVDFDRKIKDNITYIEECDVQFVIDKISDRDFDILIKNMYHSMCANIEEKRPSNRFFVNQIMSEINVEVGNIITIWDFSEEEKKKKTYLVLEIDNENNAYSTVEVEKYLDRSLKVINQDLVNISKKTPILHNYSLNSSQQKCIINRVYDCDDVNADEKNFNKALVLLKNKK